MVWSASLTTLRDILADLYPTVEDARQVVMDAGFDPASIAFSGKAKTNWHNILIEVSKHDAISDILAIAAREYPTKKDILNQVSQGTLTGVRGVDIYDHVHWKGEDDIQTLEKIIDAQSTLLPISFLEIGMERARSVGRIVRPEGSMGTGFIIGNDLLITNHHVLEDKSTAHDSIVQLNYQTTVTGLVSPIEEFKLDPDAVFVTSLQDDWTAVRVKGNPSHRWGQLDLIPVEIRKDDFVNIIQHADGLPKQIALYHNVVTYVNGNRVQYLTDTLPGSSGSPVFDSRWRVVAVHHSGGWLTEPGSQHRYYRNEGININAVIQGLTKLGLYPTP